MGQEEVYHQHFRRIYRYFYYKDVKPPVEVEDLVQDVFCRYFAKYDCTKQSTDEIRKILYGIAQNIYREWIRKILSEKTTELNDDIDYSNDDVDYDEGYAERLNKFRQDIQEAVKQLNPTLRTVITMRYLEGCTRKEVAEKLKIKEKHVHVYQRRGLKALEKIINIENLP